MLFTFSEKRKSCSQLQITKAPYYKHSCLGVKWGLHFFSEKANPPHPFFPIGLASRHMDKPTQLQETSASAPRFTDPQVSCRPLCLLPRHQALPLLRPLLKSFSHCLSCFSFFHNGSRARRRVHWTAAGFRLHLTSMQIFPNLFSSMWKASDCLFSLMNTLPISYLFWISLFQDYTSLVLHVMVFICEFWKHCRRRKLKEWSKTYWEVLHKNYPVNTGSI